MIPGELTLVLGLIVTGSQEAEHILLIKIEPCLILRLDGRRVSRETKSRLVSSLLVDIFFLDEFMEVCLDLFFSDDVEGLLIGEFFGFHVVLIVDVEDVLERGLLPGGPVLLIDVHNLRQAVGVGNG